MSTLNSEIKAAIDVQTPDRARELLRDALKDANAETFYLASLVALDDDQRQHFLQKAVDLDPFHSQAYKELQSLKQGSKPALNTPAPVVSVPPVVEVPTPAPAPSAPATSTKQLSETNMVVATVSANDVNLRVVPVDSALAVTQLRNGGEVFLIARDDHAQWFQALYQSPLGTKFGWVRADQVSDVSFNGEPITIMDLPITNFELNTRDEVQKLIAEMKKTRPSLVAVGGNYGETAKKYTRYGLFSMAGAVVFFIIGLSTVPGTNSGNNLIYTSSLVVAAFLFLVLPNFFAYKAYKADAPAREKRKILDTQIQRYNTLQNNMRSDYEKMRDDQRRDAAIGFAANLGTSLLNTAASRYITNRQKITVEHTNKK